VKSIPVTIESAMSTTGCGTRRQQAKATAKPAAAREKTRCAGTRSTQSAAGMARSTLPSELAERMRPITVSLRPSAR